MARKAIAGGTLAFLKRLFRARNVIVVSAHKVDHIPLSAVAQIALVAGVIACVSVFSYMAGSYANARHAVAEKERKLHATEAEKDLMGKDFALLQQDLSKIRKNGKELSEYSKFILDQYSGKEAKEQAAAHGDGKLIDRIGYLEKRVNEITEENNNLVLAIRARTEHKIDLFEDIISTSGLELKRMEAAVQRLPSSKPARLSGGKQARQGTGGEGGPFIPYEPTVQSAQNKALLGDIDRLVHLNKIVSVMPIGLPMGGFKEMSGFGKRVDPFHRRLAFHPGLDLAGPIGSKVLATNDGVVTTAGRAPAYGNMVDISHGLGLSTRYAHMAKILVKDGERVKKGQAIGVQGSTGRSTGPHLHYEVRYNNRPVDPGKFLEARDLYVSKK